MFYFKNRRIIVDILTIFISLLLITSGTIIYYSYQENKKSFIKMGSELISHDHQQIVEKLTYFLSPQPFVKTTLYFIEDGILTLEEFNSLSSFMQIMLTAYPEFNNVYIADEHGNVFFENRYDPVFMNQHSIRFIEKHTVPDTTRFISQIVNKAANGKYIVDLIFKDQTGKILLTEKNIPTEFKAQSQTWYVGAKGNPGLSWVDLSEVFGTHKKTLTLAHAIFVDNQFRGVVAADINLEKLHGFLKNLVTHDQSIFIINEKQQIIARSDDNLKDHVDFNTICQYEKFSTITFLNQDQMIYCTDFQLSKEKKWKIISITPLDYFISDLNAANKSNLIFSMCYLLFGLVLVIIFARRISKPIIKLAHETREMSHFHFNKKIDLVTHIYEINVLMDAIHAFRRTAYSFSKYIPKVLVEKLLDQKMIARSGGQKKEVTILFSDVEQFTKIAERLDPSFLLVHMSEYLEKVTSIIHQHSGNVDKYIGDAVMAFWGAPLDNTRQTQDACYAVLACQKNIDQLNEQWSKQGKPKFITRFGLASGMVVVGNVGSSDRLNYTVLGDSVNLAARLQTLNKIYGTHIIVNEAIYQQSKDEFVFRVLDRVIVKGKSTPVLIYELLGGVPTVEDPFQVTQEQYMLAVQFNRAFDALEKQNYDLAFQLFSALQQQYPDDVPIQIHLDRLSSQSS